MVAVTYCLNCRNTSRNFTRFIPKKNKGNKKEEMETKREKRLIEGRKDR
jgi:hypothetical protein